MAQHRNSPFWFAAAGVAIVALTVALGCSPTPGANASQSQDAGEADTDVDTADRPPSYETYFTRPTPGDPDMTIEDRVVELIEATPADAQILAAFYTFGQQRVANVFGDALDRGVDVRVVLGNTNVYDDGDAWAAVQTLRDRLGSRLTICDKGQSDGGCLGDNIHHNKFIAFTELEDGSEDVVLQTSANLTDLQLERYNNMVVIRDDTALFDAFVSYWNDLDRDETDLSYNRTETGDDATVTHFFPHDDGDPIRDALEEVDCDAGAELYLATAFFTDGRDQLAGQFRDMDSEGCDVHVVLRESSDIDSPGTAVQGRLESGDIDFGLITENTEIQLHSKYLAVDGAYEPVGDDAQVVWTGSHNYTRSALRYNDEVLLEIRDTDVFDAHLQDWQFLREQAETMNP